MTDTPTPDTTPAAVDTTPEAVDAAIGLLQRSYDFEIHTLIGKAAAMLRAVARERDETRTAIESQASAIRSLRANEESEINILRSRSRDHYIATVTLDSERDANACLTDALLAAEAEAAALRGVLLVAAEALSQEQFHGNLPRENCFLCAALETVVAALKETSDGL